jgi:adenine-specific DNA-methyltransferase
MDNFRMESPNLVQKNIDRIGTLFPNCITEIIGKDGKPKKAINFDLLRQMLSSDVVEGDEAFEFTWVGKRSSIVEANKPIRHTLRPSPQESKNWDNTENIYIEGDNLDVLKLLQESYLGMIKMIYIDPPYNTGNDFIYKDNFIQPYDLYNEQIGLFDEESREKLFRNTEANGRFHSDWCSMMYPRLLLARNLLANNGVIFISIDDGEVGNLREMCDEIFGHQNFLANLVWEKKYTVANDALFFSDNHDHILCYAKNSEEFTIGELPRTEAMDAAYKNPDNHPKGPWKATPLHAKSGSASTSGFTHTFANGVIFSPPTGTFPRYSHEALDKFYEGNEIWFGKDGTAI